MLTFDLPQTLISAELCIFEKEKGRSKVNIGRSKVTTNGVFFQEIIWHKKYQENS